MHRYDAADVRGEGALHALCRQETGPGIDIDDTGTRAHRGHGLRGCDERVRRYDDLVAGTDAERPQRELQRLSPRTDADGVVGPAVRGEVGLEPLDVAAENERAALGHRADGLEQLLEQRGIVAV